MSDYPFCLQCGRSRFEYLDKSNSEGLTWQEWLAASGSCSILEGPQNKRREALLVTLHKAWLAGEDPSEYRA